MTNEELVALIQMGENVSENMGMLYQQNKSMIWSIARPYSSFVDMDDLMQEAYFALDTAVKQCDLKIGVKFMTFASYKIKAHLGRYVANNSQTKRIPVHIQERIRQYHKFKKDYQKETGNKPDEKEIMKALNIRKKTLDELEKIIYESNCSSLDYSVGEEGEGSFLDFVPDSSDMEEEIIEGLARSELCRELWQQVETLDEVPQKVIYDRYHEGETQKSISEVLHLSRERVSQIEKEALKQLRSLTKMQQIAAAFDYECKAAYHASLGNFKGFGSSTIEYLALKHIEQEEKEREATDLFNQILQMV